MAVQRLDKPWKTISFHGSSKTRPTKAQLSQTLKNNFTAL